VLLKKASRHYVNIEIASHYHEASLSIISPKIRHSWKFLFYQKYGILGIFFITVLFCEKSGILGKFITM